MTKTPEKQVAGKAPKLTLLRRLARVWPYFSGSRAGWALAIGATIVASATEPFVPALLKPLLDRGFQRDSFNLWLVPLTLMLLFIIRGLSGFLAQFALAKVTNDGLLQLRKAMFDKLLSARLTLFADQSSSMIANTVVYEVFNGSSSLINAIMRLARDVLTLLALIGYLVYLNWKLTLIVGFLFPAVAFVIQVLSKRLYRLTKESQTATDSLAYVVEENVMAHRDVRLHGAQAGQASRFDSLSHSLRRLSMKSTAAYAGMSAITQVLAAMALSAVISIALMQSAENTTTVGGFVAFVTAMLLLIAPIKSLSDAATPVTRGLAALERGLDLMDLTPNETSGSFVKSRAVGAIEFSSVSVAYKTDAVPVLQDFNLCVTAGETLAIVGASGSGKTTLVNLLPRFVEISAGSITLDGQDIRDWNLASLRSQFAFVSQHVVMLNSSIAENVALGQPIDPAKVNECLTAANLASLLAGLPEGLDTVLGHNAMQLSGGQRQRLAIARALYKDAPILVLDEATSALDTESEIAVQDAVRRLTSGRTSLVIAHRLSTIQNADRIIMMDAGRIIESGTHKELLAKNGAFAHLYRLGFQSSSPVQTAPIQPLNV
ncbi:lipid A export permease/ATP-binding protein MsbA [Polaromonas hydrogenivorans]|uniref:Lipid A export permease/ATP-binding protein MsbA n=1 Tax=Polaromonas hydrogenivorans TaxID=335476 RepID=A0AAU7LLC7_9BURK